ncbi:hypothetical protein HMPREF1987_02362 [Peptostreptococcaceae bacterium oral taxon 113 str. W5053]|nr:hypothetical protein HMPREF1987_02362 [Peptostreptococcaceae bacterium oral taxon 113 str. W5053]
MFSEYRIKKEFFHFVEDNRDNLEKHARKMIIENLSHDTFQNLSVKRGSSASRPVDYFYTGKGFIFNSIYYGFLYFPQASKNSDKVVQRTTLIIRSL